MGILQNKVVLGLASFLIMGVATLFVLQPTVAHAAAQVQIQQDKKTGEIVVFGSVTLKNGEPEAGVHIEAATYQSDKWQNHGHKYLKPLAFATTGSDGSYKLWISKQNSYSLRGNNNVITMLVRPSGSDRTYQQSILLKSGDVASVTIAMRNPLVPILPFTVFVY